MSAEKRAAVLGVTGFIGGALPVMLRAAGFETTGVSRGSSPETAGVSAWQKPDSLDFSGHHAVINLAGETVAQRWTGASLRRMRTSRIDTTRAVLDALRRLPDGERPAVLVNASAVGFYGDRGNEVLDESSSAGSGFLAELCEEWEREAMAARDLGVRVVCLRIGIVLGHEGDAFRRLCLVFRSGIGGRLGPGTQWMPWIHVHDLRRAIIEAVTNARLTGPINATAPEPLTNADFTRRFAAALHRPAILPVPGFALKLVLGGFGSVLLASQRATPLELLDHGFRFEFSNLDAALTDLTR